MHLIVKVSPLAPAGASLDYHPASLVCDRSNNMDELVLATMQIPPLEDKWSLCGQCLREMPRGFQII